MSLIPSQYRMTINDRNKKGRLGHPWTPLMRHVLTVLIQVGPSLKGLLTVAFWWSPQIDHTNRTKLLRLHITQSYTWVMLSRCRSFRQTRLTSCFKMQPAEPIPNFFEDQSAAHVTFGQNIVFQRWEISMKLEATRPHRCLTIC